MSLIPVGDLKQWAYCPRIVYHHRVLPRLDAPTWKMREGINAQEMVERLETRRTLAAYGWQGARRRFGLWLSDQNLGLNGKLDLLLDRNGEGAVVDFKLTAGQIADNHRMQLTAYSLLVEASHGLQVQTAFLYRIPDDEVFAFKVTSAWKSQVLESVEQIRRLEADAIFPDPTPVRARCAECEYANFCGDIW